MTSNERSCSKQYCREIRQSSPARSPHPVIYTRPACASTSSEHRQNGHNQQFNRLKSGNAGKNSKHSLASGCNRSILHTTPVISYSPWIGKTQFWGRAARTLSAATARSYPIGPRRSLSTAYWFIDSGVDGNFGRATGPWTPERHGFHRAAPVRRRFAHGDARPRIKRPPCARSACQQPCCRGTVTPFFPKN